MNGTIKTCDVSKKMEEAVAALLTQKNLEEAARSVGIGSATLLRCEKMPEFPGNPLEFLVGQHTPLLLSTESGEACSESRHRFLL